MTDLVYNAMIKFRFFCSDVCRQKNIDKLIPNGMSYADWRIQKEAILHEETESTARYLQQEAAKRMESLPATDREEISERFQELITRAVEDYKEKIFHHHR